MKKLNNLKSHKQFPLKKTHPNHQRMDAMDAMGEDGAGEWLDKVAEIKAISQEVKTKYPKELV